MSVNNIIAYIRSMLKGCMNTARRVLSPINYSSIYLSCNNSIIREIKCRQNHVFYSHEDEMLLINVPGKLQKNVHTELYQY